MPTLVAYLTDGSPRGLLRRRAQIDGFPHRGYLHRQPGAADGGRAEGGEDHRLVTDVGELARAFEYPWERWTVFLHPAQRDLVERRFSGPARVSGSAGT